MTEFDEFPMLPDDPVLDRYLRSLPRLVPRPGFEDRVMARVRRPLPMRVRRARERVLAFATPGRVWWASGLAAASSAAWTVTLWSWLSGGRLETAGAWLTTEVGLPALSAALDLVTAGSRLVTLWTLGTYQLLGPPVLAAGVTMMFVPVLAAWGLYLTARTPGGERIRAYAAR